MRKFLSAPIVLAGLCFSITASADVNYALAGSGASVSGYSSYNSAMNSAALPVALTNLISETPTPWFSNGESSFIFGRSDNQQWLKLDLGQVRSINQLGALVSPNGGDREVWDWMRFSTSTDGQSWSGWGQIGSMDGIPDVLAAENLMTLSVFRDVRYVHFEFGPTSTDYGGDGSRVVRLYASSVAAVPEAETYAMLLAGLGLMGSIVRRRKSSLA